MNDTKRYHNITRSKLRLCDDSAFPAGWDSPRLGAAGRVFRILADTLVAGTAALALPIATPLEGSCAFAGGYSRRHNWSLRRGGGGGGGFGDSGGDLGGSSGGDSRGAIVDDCSDPSLRSLGRLRDALCIERVLLHALEGGRAACTALLLLVAVAAAIDRCANV